MPYHFSPEEINQLEQFRDSAANFKAIVDSLPGDMRSPEHSQQFNQLRADARALLKGNFSEDIPRAITGNASRDRSITLVVILGVILTLAGLAINSIVIEDVLLISLGCCVSSGGMLLIMGAFGVLAMKTLRDRVSTAQDLSQRCDLLLYQIDYQLQMSGVGQKPPTPTTPPVSEFGPPPPGRPEGLPPIESSPGPIPYDPPEDF